MASKKNSELQARLDELGKGVSGGGVLSLDSVDASHLHRFVTGAVRAGGLVSFSRTRDGGAVVLTILHDDLNGGRYKDYFGSEREVADMIEEMAGIWGEAE